MQQPISPQTFEGANLPGSLPPSKAVKAIAAATGVNIAASLATRSVNKHETAVNANVVSVAGTNGAYNVVYSDHHVPNHPQTTEGVDALMLEQRMIYTEADVNEYFTWLESSGDPEARQYREILQVARRDRKPVFFVDANLSSPSGVDERLKANIVRTIESALGVSLMGYTAAKLHNASKRNAIGRRELLTHIFKGAVAMYLLTPRLENLARSMSDDPPDESSVSRKTERGLQSVNSVIHPELNIPLTLNHRNAIMAQNAEAVSRVLAKELGRAPKSALYVGSLHTGIERELQGNEARRVQHINQHPELCHKGEIARVDFVDEDGAEKVRIQILQDPAFR
jgi:hypothetical protein